MKPLDNQDRMKMLEIIEGMYERKSTIIRSWLLIEKRYYLLRESTIADAILDEIACSSHRAELNSMRKNKKIGNIN